MQDRKVVVVGMGMLSPIGGTHDEILSNMMSGTSGVTAAPQLFDELGLDCQVHGAVASDYEEQLGIRIPKALSEQGRMAYYASVEALRQAGLIDAVDVRSRLLDDAGTFIGTGGAPIALINSYLTQVASLTDVPADRRGKVKRKFMRAVQHVMTSSVSAGMSVAFGSRGEPVSVASACATAHHNIIAASRAIKLGELDLAIAGGVEDTCPYTALFFDALGALSSDHNDTPEAASRPFAVDRDGFVPSSGAGVLALASDTYAHTHGLPVLAEIAGWGSNSNGASMVDPTVEGEERVMQQALRQTDIPATAIDLVSAHGTATPAGDHVEAQAIMLVFGSRQPYVNATKSMLGHGLGASGAWSVCMTIMQMHQARMHATINCDTLDPRCQVLNVVREATNASIETAMVNAFGFGGANASLVLRLP